jgi:hypothetical protein
MQHAGADEEYRYYLSYPHHPQCLERGLSAGFGDVGGRGDEREMYVTILELFFVCPNECSILHQWTKQKL